MLKGCNIQETFFIAAEFSKMMYKRQIGQNNHKKCRNKPSMRSKGELLRSIWAAFETPRISISTLYSAI